MDDLWSQIKDILNNIIGNHVDWEDPKCMITEHFSVKEALWLNRLGRMATVEDGLTDSCKSNLIDLFHRMEKVREYLNNPAIIVTSSFRPQTYNQVVGGAPASAHLYGMAVDWQIAGQNCDYLRSLLVPKLEEWGMRCENTQGTDWVHLDTMGVTNLRFFKP